MLKIYSFPAQWLSAELIQSILYTVLSKLLLNISAKLFHEKCDNISFYQDPDNVFNIFTIPLIPLFIVPIKQNY